MAKNNPKAKRTAPDGMMNIVTVYRFQVPKPAGSGGFKLPPHAMAQLRLAHGLENRLVELSLENDNKIVEVYRSFPAVAAIEDEIDAATEEYERIWPEVKAERVKQRTRSPVGPAVDALAAAKARLRKARAARKAEIENIKADPSQKAVLTSAMNDVRSAHNAAIKALYAEFVQEGGLYWATYNLLVQKSKTADERVIDRRTEGFPAQRRYRRWDGSGILAVQPQRGSKDPARTHRRLSTPGGKWQSVLRLPRNVDSPGADGPDYRPGDRRPQWKRFDQRQTIYFGCGSKVPPIIVPVAVPRLPPPEADITSAELVVTRVASRSLVSVNVCARLTLPERTKFGGQVSVVHLGWRREKDGGLRAATWRTSKPVVLPKHVREFLIQDTPTSGRIVLSKQWRDRLNHMDQLRSARGIAMDEIRARLVEWLGGQEPIDIGDRDGKLLTAGTVKTWRSPSRFATLALRWREDPPEDGADIAALLEAWRKSDKLMWEKEASGRRKALRHRLEIYRRTASWLAVISERVIVDDTDISALLARGRKNDVPSVVEARASSQRVDVAPHEIRKAIKNTCYREQVPLTVANHRGTTLTHSVCGHVNPADERWVISAEVVCDGCGRTFDQDSNSTANVLRQVLDEREGESAAE